jgi:hypothetical protein
MTTWQFVDSIAASPTVLLDLNASPFAVDVQRVDLSPPEYQQAWGDNSLAHGARLVWEKAVNRTLVIPLHITTSTVAAQETAIQNLGLMLARNSILKVQYGNTPIFFRTFANPKYAMKIRRALRDSSSVDLAIAAEPFGYGSRVEVTGSPFTVSNNPVAGTNPTWFDITNVPGDAPTPLLLLVTSTGASGAPSGMVNKWLHLATRRRGTPSLLNPVVQAEGMLASTDTALVPSNNAAFSGAGQNGMRVTFATNATMTVRLSDQFPQDDVARIDNRGEYLVYARCSKTVAGDTIDVQFRYGTGVVNHVSNDVQRCPAGQAGPFFLNLGKLPVPAYSDPVYQGFSGVETKAKNSWVALYAQRVSGTGNLDIDYLYMVPADDQTLICQFPVTDTTYAIDGTTDGGGAVYAAPTTLDEVLNIAFPPKIVGGGGFPEVIPGTQVNRIYWLRNIDPNGTVDAVGDTSTIRAYVWPRWREAIRP